ncbi:MAG TPA: TonB family protein [Bryobacteraceae bacterium]|nr:TonB family protein [Bryobacteraceae bacterium]
MRKAILIALTSTTVFASDCSGSDWIGAIEQAEIAMRRGELANAEQILNSTVDQAKSKYGRSSTALDQPLELLAQVYEREKRYADAASVEQQRIDIWTEVSGDSGVAVGRVLHQLSSVEQHAGNFPAAESNARRALAIMTAEFAGKPPAAQAAADLADVLIAENHTEEAVEMLESAEKIFGPASMLGAGIAARRAAILKQPAPVQSVTVYKIGGEVSPPRIRTHVEPEYSEEAQTHKLGGTVQLNIVVDAAGIPTQIAVLRPVGMGLDEKAVEAVSQWRFAPAMKNGTPVPVSIQVEVSFHSL